MLVHIREILTIVCLIIVCLAAVVFIIKTRMACRDMLREDNLYELAFKDNLTGLFNRTAYNRYTRELEVTKHGQIWIMLFDIDEFKTINDTKGHLAGDRVLCSAADLLNRVFAMHGHKIYRIGGDEFAVIARNTDEEQVVSMLLRLGDFEKTMHSFRFSKGYARVDRGSNGGFERAFFDADKMLYADKESRKHQVEL